MPVFNERATLASAIKEVLNVGFPCEVELVVVDDGSTDGTRSLYPGLAGDPRVKVHMHDRNQGKGAAIRTAAAVADGDYLIMCDADLEYAPAEIPSLLAPVIAGQAQVVALWILLRERFARLDQVQHGVAHVDATQSQRGRGDLVRV
jgi:glycosyltransferase involved in cell wall biosynthesis